MNIENILLQKIKLIRSLNYKINIFCNFISINKPILSERRKQMNLTWNKCQGDDWCSLYSVDLDNSHFDNMEGVYVIWHGGNDPKTVRIVQGVIRGDRLAAHRDDPEVQIYSSYTLFVTWAKVATVFKNGVEAYLANTLNPLVGECFPDVTPIQVNLPW